MRSSARCCSFQLFAGTNRSSGAETHWNIYSHCGELQWLSAPTGGCWLHYSHIIHKQDINYDTVMQIKLRSKNELQTAAAVKCNINSRNIIPGASGITEKHSQEHFTALWLLFHSYFGSFPHVSGSMWLIETTLFESCPVRRLHRMKRMKGNCIWCGSAGWKWELSHIVKRKVSLQRETFFKA